jgi:hypothetical protein
LNFKNHFISFRILQGVIYPRIKITVLNIRLRDHGRFVRRLRLAAAVGSNRVSASTLHLRKEMHSVFETLFSLLFGRSDNRQRAEADEFRENTACFSVLLLNFI